MAPSRRGPHERQGPPPALRTGIQPPGGDLLKAFVCRCEDLTEKDVREAIHEGYTCFEDLKRFLGLATGPCQGKACVAAATRILAQERGIDPAEVDVMTFRPPVRPVSLATLAAEDAEGGE